MQQMTVVIVGVILLAVMKRKTSKDLKRKTSKDLVLKYAKAIEEETGVKQRIDRSAYF